MKVRPEYFSWALERRERYGVAIPKRDAYSLIGHVGGDGFAHAYASGKYCTAEAIQQSSIREQCEALAELLVDHARNTLDLSAAQRIGTQLGWAPERIAALQQETLAMFRVETYSEKDPWSCDNVHDRTDSPRSRRDRERSRRLVLQFRNPASRYRSWLRNRSLPYKEKRRRTVSSQEVR